MTIDQIYNDYIETKSVILDAHVIKSYQSAYDTHILPTFGARHIDTLNYIDYQNFSNNLLNSGKKPKTVKNIFVVISGIYKFAIKNGWYEGELYHKMIEYPKYDNRFYINISPEIQKKYFSAILSCKDEIYKDIFFFLLHGRRIGEVLKLKWEYVDLVLGRVYFPASQNKSRKNLSFDLTEKMISILRTHQEKAIDNQGTIFITGYVFINPKTKTRFKTYVKAWRRLLDTRNLDYVKIHSIRHLVISYCLNVLKLPIQDVSVMAGHTDIKSTLIYYNPDPAIAKECTNELLSSLKTKGELSVEKINQAYGLGECIQTVLFSDKKFKEIRK